MRSLLTRLFTFGLLSAGIFGILGYQMILAPTGPEQPVLYQVKKGAPLSKIAEALEHQGVLKSAWSLKLLARLNQLGGQIHTGSYRFEGEASPRQILDRLTSGDVEKASLTIPEGFTLEQIVRRFAEQGYADLVKLRQLARDSKFTRSLKINAETLEGYLFPETYHFIPGAGEEDLLKMMVNQFHRNYSAKLRQQAKKLHLNQHQHVTLASIIEKETGQVAEMPLISSVFHNRLRKGIPLQTDPTVIYGLEDFDGNLTRKHLQTPTAYNTYQFSGLPPGPIASPGRAALEAAANPEQSNYLYFVARGDGSHQFSRTLKEHNQAVRRYQLKRRR